MRLWMLDTGSHCKQIVYIASNAWPSLLIVYSFKLQAFLLDFSVFGERGGGSPKGEKRVQYWNKCSPTSQQSPLSSSSSSSSFPLLFIYIFICFWIPSTQLLLSCWKTFHGIFDTYKSITGRSIPSLFLILLWVLKLTSLIFLGFLYLIPFFVTCLWYFIFLLVAYP